MQPEACEQKTTAPGPGGTPTPPPAGPATPPE